MLPACWTSSYKSAGVRPLLVSSWKKISNRCSSPNNLMSRMLVKVSIHHITLHASHTYIPCIHPNHSYRLDFPTRNAISLKSGYRARSTFVVTTWTSAARTTSEPKTSEPLASYYHPAHSNVIINCLTSFTRSVTQVDCISLKKFQVVIESNPKVIVSRNVSAI
jgi:hypothetical protein